jgi:hypothetical protein
MAKRGALRLVLNGAILMLVGMLVGFPGFFFGPPTSMDDEFRLFFRQSHLIPIAQGAWTIASGAVLPSLALSDALASVLVWSIIVSDYSILLAQSAWGIALAIGWTEAAGKQVQHSPLAPLYLGALGMTAVGALAGIILITVGAFRALRQTNCPVRTIH